MNITRYLTTLSLRVTLLSVLLVSTGTLSVQTSHAHSPDSFSMQGQCPPSWVEVTGDNFTVRMPPQFQRKQSNLPNVRNPPGDMYQASDGNITYIVRSISYAGTNTDDRGKLKGYRDLYRESLVRSTNDGGTKTILKGNQSLGGFIGEQLQVTSAGKSILLNLYVRGERVYALEVSPAIEGNAAVDCFLNSFRFTQQAIKDWPRDPDIDAGKEITRRQRTITESIRDPIILPPTPPPPPPIFFCECEPGFGKETPGNELNHAAVFPCPTPDMNYTKAAEDHQFSGTGLLSVNFSATGEVIILEVIKALPYGLTEEAIRAAKTIKFCPAVKNGVRVDTIGELPFTFTLKVRKIEAPRPIRKTPKRRS